MGPNLLSFFLIDNEKLSLKVRRKQGKRREKEQGYKSILPHRYKTTQGQAYGRSEEADP